MDDELANLKRGRRSCGYGANKPWWEPRAYYLVFRTVEAERRFVGDRVEGPYAKSRRYLMTLPSFARERSEYHPCRRGLAGVVKDLRAARKATWMTL